MVKCPYVRHFVDYGQTWARKMTLLVQISSAALLLEHFSNVLLETNIRVLLMVLLTYHCWG